MIQIKEIKEGVIINILVQPRASKNEIVGIRDDFLKIRLTAPPVEGKANRECISILAKRLNVSRKAIEIIKGDKSRRKTVKIAGVTKKEIEALFL